MRSGLVAEFSEPERAAEAVRALKRAGYSRLDVCMPFPSKEVEQALDAPRSRLPRYVLFGAIAGGSLAYLVQWWTQAVDYPLNVGSRPSHAGPAFLPITFELSVLAGALTAFFGMLLFCGLPRLHHPLFDLEGFERASVDRYFVTIDAADPVYDEDASTRELERHGPLRVVSLVTPEEPGP